MNLPYCTRIQLIDELKSSHLFTELIQKAISQAEKSHSTQKRDNGHSYLEEHIYPIALDLLQRYKNHAEVEDILISALLHDVLEDDDQILEEIFRQDFGETIFTYVKFLTKVKDSSKTLTQEEKFERNRIYLKNISNGPMIPQIVKVADRVFNVKTLGHLKGTPKFERYIKETKELFLPFAQEINQDYFELLQEELLKLS